MSATAKFKRSYDPLMSFLDKWTGKIQDRCLPEEQSKACFYIWCRYTMSIRVLYKICEPQYIPDIYVIARSCLEYSASFKAVSVEPELAKAYVEYPDTARAYYGKVLEGLGDHSALAKLEPQLKGIFGDDWRAKAKFSWCHPTNISTLVNTYGGPDVRRLYALWSHFTHGSALSLEILQKMLPTQDALDKVIVAVYAQYVLITRDLIDLAWGVIVTYDSENCKREFNAIAVAGI